MKGSLNHHRGHNPQLENCSSRGWRRASEHVSVRVFQRTNRWVKPSLNVERGHRPMGLGSEWNKRRRNSAKQQCSRVCVLAHHDVNSSLLQRNFNPATWLLWQGIASKTPCGLAPGGCSERLLCLPSTSSYFKTVSSAAHSLPFLPRRPLILPHSLSYITRKFGQLWQKTIWQHLTQTGQRKPVGRRTGNFRQCHACASGSV